MTHAVEGDAVDVSVVVVTYEAPRWVERCLDSLRSAVDQSPLVIETVVVDNASGPETRALLSGAAVRLVQQETNTGFGRACNVGVSRSKGRLVVMVNPDTLVPVGAIEALAAFYDERPSRGLVGGRTVSPDGATDPRSCWGAMTLWSLFCSAVGLTSVFRGSRLFDPESMGGWDRDSVREVDVVTGCLLLTSRILWDELGGFDEDFFMYGEDADLSWRAWQSGLRPAITPAAEIVHAVGASSSSSLNKQRLLLRGRAHLARKRWHGVRRLLARLLMLCGAGVRAGLHGRGSDARVIWAERDDWIRGWAPRFVGPASVGDS